MERKARIDIKNHFYHIIGRGQRKNPIFFSPADKLVFLIILTKMLLEYDIRLYAFCLMTNHFHLLIYRSNDSLGRFMLSLNTKYAIYFNKKYGLTGHVFQGRYKSYIVLNERYLLNIVYYIHMNPVKAGMVQFPEDYKFSSYLFYKNGKDVGVPLKRIDNYEDESNIDDIYFEVYKDSIGSKDSYNLLEKRKSTAGKGKFLERRKRLDNINKDLEIFLNKYGLTIIDLKEIKWNRKYGKMQREIVKKLFIMGYYRSDIARVFERSKAWVTKALKQINEKNKK